MNKIYKIISIFVILILASVVAYAAIANEKIAVPGNEDVSTVANAKTETDAEAAARLAYNDIWVKADLNQISTTSPGWQDVISQQIYLNYDSTVIVQFSAETQSAKLTPIIASIDGQYISPGTVFFDGGVQNIQTNWQAHSYTFFKDYVPTGYHTVKVQYTSNGGKSTLWYKTLVITANGNGHTGGQPVVTVEPPMVTTQ